MKKTIIILVISILFFVAPVILLAQSPPHPNGGNGPNGSNTPVGGGAPIGSGMIIMLVLGSAYASKKRIAGFFED